MGLDGVVYRKRTHLQLGPDEALAQVDRDTGEVYFSDDGLSRRHNEGREAASVRFGNIAMIATLREEIGHILGPQSLLYTKVVYSGSHSGDFIPLTELSRLSEEIASIRKTGKYSDDLLNFLDQLEQLIRTALREGNPIVFV